MGAKVPEAGWYDDPQDPEQLRWWDGSRWSERRQPRSAAMPPPPPLSQSYGIPLGDPNEGAGGGPAGGSAGGSTGGPTGGSAGGPGDPWGSATSGPSGPFSSPSPSAASSAWADAPAGGFPGSASATVTGAAPPRSFWEAIRVCLTKYVDGKGRASRSEYWYFALFTLLLDLATGGFAAFLTIIPSITVNVRRLHDIGKSAWALLWVLLPIIGWIVLIVYAVRPGEPSANVYG